MFICHNRINSFAFIFYFQSRIFLRKKCIWCLSVFFFDSYFSCDRRSTLDVHGSDGDIFSLPSSKRVIEIVTILRKIIFPGIFEEYHVTNDNIRYHLGARNGSPKRWCNNVAIVGPHRVFANHMICLLISNTPWYFKTPFLEKVKGDHGLKIPPGVVNIKTTPRPFWDHSLPHITKPSSWIYKWGLHFWLNRFGPNDGLTKHTSSTLYNMHNIG